MSGDISAGTGWIRIARVFRALRLMRLFRLLRFFQMVAAMILKQEMSLEIQDKMQKIMLLTAFVRAHINAQREMVKYFGTNQTIDGVEVTRATLQSQLAVYRAVLSAVELSSQEHELYNQLLKEVRCVRESKAVAEELEQFIIDAHKGGIISVREAESILHPLH